MSSGSATGGFTRLVSWQRSGTAFHLKSIAASNTHSRFWISGWTFVSDDWQCLPWACAPLLLIVVVAGPSLRCLPSPGSSCSWPLVSTPGVPSGPRCTLKDKRQCHLHVLDAINYSSLIVKYWWMYQILSYFTNTMLVIKCIEFHMTKYYNRLYIMLWSKWTKPYQMIAGLSFPLQHLPLLWPLGRILHRLDPPCCLLPAFCWSSHWSAMQQWKS